MHQDNKSKLSHKLLVGKKYITLETEIAKKFNYFVTEIGSSLTRNILTPSKPFGNFLKKVSTTLPERCLTINDHKLCCKSIDNKKYYYVSSVVYFTSDIKFRHQILKCSIFYNLKYFSLLIYCLLRFYTQSAKLCNHILAWSNGFDSFYQLSRTAQKF